MAKKKYIGNLRVDEEVLVYLRQMAERDMRPLSNLVSMIIVKAVEADKRLHAARRKA